MTYHKYAKLCQDGVLAVLVWLAAASAMAAAPVAVNTVVPITLEEDDPNASVSLVGLFQDADNDPLIYSVTSDSPSSLFDDPEVQGDVLFFNLAQDQNNSNGEVRVRASDGSGNDEVRFDVVVLPVNDAPSLTPGADQTVVQDTGAHTVSNWVAASSPGPSDEDDQELTFNVTGNSNPTLFSVPPAVDSNGTLTFTLAAGQVGSAQITLNASDDGGTANGGVDVSPDESFTITVVDNNDPPTFTPGSNVTVDEDSGPYDQPWATSISAGPPDEVGQTLTFNVSVDQPGLFSAGPAIDSTGELTFTPALNAQGTAAVTVNLSDDGGTDGGGDDTSDDETFTITINPVNDAPSFTPGPSVTVDEDSGPYAQPWAGSIVAGPADEAGQALTFTVTPDQPGLFSAGPAIDITGELTFTPALNAQGTATVTVSLADDGGTVGGGDDTSDDETFTITINPVNDAPTFTPGSNVTVDEDSGPYAQPWAGSPVPGPGDEAGQVLTFTVTPDEPGLFSAPPAIDGTTGELTFTPALNAQGTTTVTVSLSDDGGTAGTGGDDTADDETFTITINPINDAPSFTPGPNVAVDEDSGPYAQPWAGSPVPGPSDESGQALTFNVSNDNAGLFSAQPAIDSAGELTFTPALNARGTATVTVSLSDDGGTAGGGDDTSDDETFTITINPVNDAPSFTPGPDVTVDEDSGPYAQPWAGSPVPGPADESGQVLTFTVTPDQPGLFSVPPAIDGTTGELTFTPALNANGVALVTVSLSDDGGTAGTGGDDTSDDETFTITINAVNDAPSFTPGPNVAVDEDSGSYDQPWAGSVVAGPADESGQTLTFTVTNNNAGLFSTPPAIDSTGRLTFTPALNAQGTATVTVRLSDNGGIADGGDDTADDVTFTITIGAVNDPPSFTAGGNQTVLEDAGSVTVPGWATALSAGPADEAGQVLTFEVVTNSNPSLFATAPAVDGQTGDLSFTTAADANGTATITLLVRDNGGGTAASPPASFDITVTAVNDAPTFTPGPTVNVDEDAGPQTISGWATDISAGPADEAGQALTFNVVNNSNPALFAVPPSLDATTGDLVFETDVDANGSATITVNLSDDGGTADGGEDTSVDRSFDIVVAGVNDNPAAEDDEVVIAEDSGTVSIPVLANDYLAEQPTTIVSAGIDGESQGTPQVVLDQTGNPIGGANGTVTISGDQIEYTPKDDFFGDDFFTYTIQDAEGDTSTATVQVTVTAVNDPPTAPSLRNYTVLENGILDIDEVEGLMFGAYDVEGAVVGPDGQPVGSTMTIQVVTFPATGVVSVDNVTGSFTYTPAVDFIGDVSMTYRVSDGGVQSEIYEARIKVIEAPEPPEPPEPGEVATIWNLADVPLEQSTSVSPNVIVMMDDSGSMDWNISVSGNQDGGFVIDNSDTANRSERSTTYFYLWDLPNNLFGSSSTNGRILPTEEALDDDNDMDGNHYGVWRAQNHLYNRLYYNPAVRYTPWIGLDVNNDPFGNADPTNIRLNPRNLDDDFNLLDEDHDYDSDRVPQADGGTEDVDVDGLYIPRYYTTTATPPLEWDDQHELVEIRPENEPFVGGPDRDDCAVDDDDPMDCTYEQEIQNFANYFQYYRTREYAAKNALGKVVSQVQDIRIGYETINDNYSEDVREMNDLYTEGNKAKLLNEIYRTNSNGSTPLRRALDRAGDIFSGTRGEDPILPAPEGFCQQNFTLLFSDGYWNGSDPSQDNEDGDGSSDFDGGVYADSEHETLADVAMYFYERDLRPGMDDLVPVGSRDRLGAPPDTFDDNTVRMHQHMKTYTVAFGVVGNVDTDDIPSDPTVAFNWPDPEDSPEGKIDDMLHAAVNGRGQFLSAVDPQELQSQLEAAFLEFTQAASSTSAAAFNSTSLQTDTLLYRGFYDLRDSSGELSAIEVNDDGTLGNTIWNASELLDDKLPNARKLVTFDRDAWSGIAFRPGGLTADQELLLDDDAVSYLRGARGQEQPSGDLRRRATTGGVLGDIVNSSPVFVGKPLGLDRDEEPWPTQLYSAFASAHVDRPGVVYVGANDGILHGFDAESGEELFGYIPNKVIDGSQRFHNDLNEFTSPFYQHKFFVDLTPRISDAYVDGEWRTILLGGLGAGGKGFFALDVTNPGASFSSETNATGTVLWEFTDEDDTSPNANLDPEGNPVKDLGYSLSLPTVAMSNVVDGGEQEWVAIFGNGPNATAGIAKLFVLFMDRGLNGWGDSGDFIKLDTGRGVPVAPAPLAGYPNGLGTPALVDTDLNGTVDWVYAGDQLGNLYRFDLCNRDADGDCATTASGWSVTRLFTATYDDGSVEHVQPILSQPLVMKHPTEQGFLVIFGTGSYMTKEDADSEEIQSIYAIWDRGEDNPATALDDTKELRLVEQTLTNVVDDSVNPAVTRRVPSRNVVEYEPDAAGDPGTFGWYVDLDMPRASNTLSGASNSDTSGKAPPAPQFPGEKAIRRFVLRNGAIVTTTVLPSLDEFSCFGTRPGAILVLDALNGGDHREPIVDFNNDGVIDEGDLLDTGAGDPFAAGLLFNQDQLDGALVDLSTLGGEGDMDWLFACGGNECVPFRIEAPSDSRTGRLSWRELDPSN